MPGNLTAGASDTSCETGGESTGRDVGDTSAFASPASTRCKPGETDVGDVEAGAIDWAHDKDPEELWKLMGRLAQRSAGLLRPGGRVNTRLAAIKYRWMG